MLERCAVLKWAASGAMSLTGQPDGAPVLSPAPVLAMLETVVEELTQVTRDTGKRVHLDPAELITARAALAGYTRRGRTSAGGSSFLLRSADGWCAVTLSRPDDLTAVPAILGVLGLNEAAISVEPRAVPAAEGLAVERLAAALAAAALVRPAEELAGAAQLLGVPAAALPAAAPDMDRNWSSWQAARIAPPSPAARLTGAVVADRSSMWAGPLCGRLLGLAGADVIKVESPDRPDGARAGNPQFFDWLHAGHRSVAVDFTTKSGRAALKALLSAADNVIEASRPRALAAHGLAPDMISHPDGQVWLSITG
jgi:crotonobetainyl-CoA:carnitine CoA-transferase CaiB-like acyl-CoA transferase